MPSTYLFYDIESTGLNKCFDQVLQFAAIRTDDAFHELSRHEINIRLNNDVIPSPTATITHRIGPSVFQTGVTELAGIQKIHALLNTPHTISIGYNSLGFDDEFLRFSFYKNLLPPYTHQYANHCGRMDLYPITVLYYLFKPDLLQWPIQNENVSFKLENLNTCNQLAHGQAHNAMVDVEATLALAKKLSQDKILWQYVTQYFDKSTDEERLQQCDSTATIHQKKYAVGLLVSGKIGAQSQFLAPVIYLGKHRHYKNQHLWLRLDDPILSTTTLSNVADTTRIVRKRLGEPPFFLPFKTRYEHKLSAERKAIVDCNTIWLSQNSTIFEAIMAFHQNNQYPVVPNCDADAALYQLDFTSASEENIFRQFHQASPAEKPNILDKIPTNERKIQAVRLLGRHFPEYLSTEQNTYFQQYLDSIYHDGAAACPVDFRGAQKLTRQNALLETEALLKRTDLDAQQVGLLQELQDYYSLH